MAISSNLLGEATNLPSPVLEAKILATKIEADLDSAIYHGSTSVWISSDTLWTYAAYKRGKESREDFLQATQDTLARKYVYESDWTSLHVNRRGSGDLVVELRP